MKSNTLMQCSPTSSFRITDPLALHMQWSAVYTCTFYSVVRLSVLLKNETSIQRWYSVLKRIFGKTVIRAHFLNKNIFWLPIFFPRLFYDILLLIFKNISPRLWKDKLSVGNFIGKGYKMAFFIRCKKYPLKSSN